MSISRDQITRGIFVGVVLTLAITLSAAPSASSSAPVTKPPLASAPKSHVGDKAPTWKISPGGPDRLINSVAVSADGARVVGGTFYHNYGATESRRGPARPASGAPPSELGKFGVYCYNATGTQEWRDEFEGWQGVYWVALSANGARAAAGGFMSQQSPQGFVRAYDANNGGRQLLAVQTKERVNQVALSADGSSLIAAAETLMLFRYVAAKNAYEKFGEFKSASGKAFVSAAISADGSTVVYADYGGEVGVMCNLDSSGYFTPMARWHVPGTQAGDFCHMLDLSPDGKYFAAGGAKGLFYFFDVSDFVARGGPTQHYDTSVKGAVYGVAVAGNGSLFAGVVNRDDAGVGYLITVANQGAKQFTTLHNPNCVVLNATHGMMAVADGHSSDIHPEQDAGRFYLFDTATGAQRWSCPTAKMSWPIAIAANNGAVVGGSDDSYIYYFAP
jgi:WD40 repeat protein